MPTETYDLVFKGALARGADLSQSKRNIAQLFKISDTKVESLFSGRPVTLKKNLDFATATKYRVAIKKAGCLVDLVDKTDTPADSAKSEPQRLTPAKPEHGVSSEFGDAALRKKEAASEPPQPPLPEVEEVDVHSVPAAVARQANSASVLSLAPVTGNLVDSSEIERPDPVIVQIGHIEVKEVGVDLLSDDEKSVFVPADIPLNIDIAPVGSDLIRESERESVEVVEIDLSDFSVAEPGEDLGQEKQTKEPVNPNISHLSLE